MAAGRDKPAGTARGESLASGPALAVLAGLGGPAPCGGRAVGAGWGPGLACVGPCHRGAVRRAVRRIAVVVVVQVEPELERVFVVSFVEVV